MNPTVKIIAVGFIYPLGKLFEYDVDITHFKATDFDGGKI
jgi:hypothetical protein